MKYWKNSDQPDGNQGGNPNEMPCGSSGMTDLSQRHKLDESMDPSNYGYPHHHHHHQAMPAYEETSREGNEETMGKPATTTAAIPPVPNGQLVTYFMMQGNNCKYIFCHCRSGISNGLRPEGKQSV